MGIYTQAQALVSQIADTEKLLSMAAGHPLMELGLRRKLDQLREDLSKNNSQSIEAKIELLFSGMAVSGSNGIKADFVGKVVTPFQEIVKTHFALARFGRVGKRGKVKDSAETRLFLTALPRGSFGVELSQLEPEDLFASEDIIVAMNNVVSLISDVVESDSKFETVLEDVPKRALSNLKKFLKEIASEKSFLKIEIGNRIAEFSRNDIFVAYSRVSEAFNENVNSVINGVFKGILLDSEKFEILDEYGERISGTISDEIDEEELVNYDRNFLNQRCEIHLKVYTTTFKDGNKKISYELLEIRE